jgi:hypothetical protein
MNENSITTYRISKGNKIGLWILCGFFTLGGIHMLIYPFLGLQPFDLGQKLILAIFGSGMLLGSLLGIFWILHFKIETEFGRIRLTGVFQTRELMLSEVRGYRIVPDKWIFLYGENPRPVLKISLVMENQKEFLHWITGQNLKNLNEADLQMDLKTARADEKLGSNETQRREGLQRAKSWARFLGFLSLGSGFWALFYPKPYQVAVGALILMPFIALGSMAWFKGALRFNVKPKSVYGSVDLVLVGVNFLALRAIFDWNVFDWKPFWVPFLAATFFLLALLKLCPTDSRTMKSFLFSGLFFSAIYGFGATLCLNGMLDSSQPAIYETHLTDKRVSRGTKSITYYMTLTPWGGQTDSREWRVARQAFNRHEIGDKVMVCLKAGALHIPWYYVY